MSESRSESTQEFFRRGGCERPDTVLLWPLQDRGNGKKPVPSPRLIVQLRMAGCCVQYCFPRPLFPSFISGSIIGREQHTEKLGTAQPERDRASSVRQFG